VVPRQSLPWLLFIEIWGFAPVETHVCQLRWINLKKWKPYIIEHFQGVIFVGCRIHFCANITNFKWMNVKLGWIQLGMYRISGSWIFYNRYGLSSIWYRVNAAIWNLCILFVYLSIGLQYSWSPKIAIVLVMLNVYILYMACNTQLWLKKCY
jgi:hypothetical protein